MFTCTLQLTILGIVRKALLFLNDYYSVSCQFNMEVFVKMILTNCERDTLVHAVSVLLRYHQFSCDMVGREYDKALIKYYHDLLYKLEGVDDV